MPMLYGLSILFFLLAIPLLMGKGSWLIAGYNTASKEEKAKYDEKKLCRATGMICLLIGLLTIGLGYFNSELFGLIYGGIILVVVIAFIFYANIGCKKK